MKYWFSAKRYGWGWFPATWQGWLVLGAYVAIAIYQIIAVETYTLVPGEILAIVIPRIVALTLVLIAICLMTGEKPRRHSAKR